MNAWTSVLVAFTDNDRTTDQSWRSWLYAERQTAVTWAASCVRQTVAGRVANRSSRRQRSQVAELLTVQVCVCLRVDHSCRRVDASATWHVAEMSAKPSDTVCCKTHSRRGIADWYSRSSADLMTSVCLTYRQLDLPALVNQLSDFNILPKYLKSKQPLTRT